MVSRTLHVLSNKEPPDHTRHSHRMPPPLQQPPILKQKHAEGQSDGDGKEKPLAMLKQTPLEWGLDYYTRQGDFFFPPPPPHCLGKLLMTTGIEASWQGTSRDQRQRDRGFVVQRRASKKAHPLGAFVRGLCLTSKSCYTKITGCRYPNKNKSRVLPAHPNDFREEPLTAGWQTPQPLSLCANLKKLLALGYHTQKSQKSNTVIPSACTASFTCSSWSYYKEKWRRKAHYRHFTDKETVAQKGSDLSCSPVEEQGSRVKPLKSQSDALSPELL